jgi:hypothetical protein
MIEISLKGTYSIWVEPIRLYYQHTDSRPSSHVRYVPDLNCMRSLQSTQVEGKAARQHIDSRTLITYLSRSTQSLDILSQVTIEVA